MSRELAISQKVSKNLGNKSRKGTKLWRPIHKKAIEQLSEKIRQLQKKSKIFFPDRRPRPDLIVVGEDGVVIAVEVQRDLKSIMRWFDLMLEKVSMYKGTDYDYVLFVDLLDFSENLLLDVKEFDFVDCWKDVIESHDKECKEEVGCDMLRSILDMLGSISEAY